jgi:hypothetical protein
MTVDGATAASISIRDRFRTVVRGTGDTRVRATWRVLLAYPVLWLLTGGGLTVMTQDALGVIPSGSDPAGGLAQSLLHAGFLVVALALWARYLDRRSLADYGVSLTARWFLGALGGFAAVVIGFGAWFAVGAGMGRTSVTLAPSYPEGSLVVGLAILVVALALHAAVQQVVFFRVILENAAEGLHSRGVEPTRAALSALPVAVLLFIVMHTIAPGLRIIDVALVGAAFGLLYLHTGNLALGTGMHFGALYAGSVLFVRNPAAGPSVFEVADTLPGVLGTVNQYGFPKMVVAYLVLAAWLHWRRGPLGVKREIARWP